MIKIWICYQRQKQEIQAVYFKSLIPIDILTANIFKNKGGVYSCWNGNHFYVVLFCITPIYI